MVAYLDVTAPDFRLESPEVAAAFSEHWYADTGLGMAVLHHRDVTALLREPALAQSGRYLLEGAGITEGPVWDWFVPIILHQRGEEHLRLRSLVSAAFTPRAVAGTRAFVRDTAAALADRLADGGDFVDVYADPLPRAVICHLLGLTDGETATAVGTWTDEIGELWYIGTRPEIYPRVERAILALSGFVEDALRSRDGHGDDLVSALVRAQRGDARLSWEELRTLVVSIVFAAHDTSRRQLGQVMAVLCERPEVWDEVARDPGLAERACEEMLRFAPAAPMITRFAMESFEHGGRAVEAGEFVMLCAHTALRDPAVYDAPEEFDLHRERRGAALTFGAGPHHCLGAALARIEIEETLVALTSRLGRPAADGPQRWRSPLFIYGPESLPVRFGTPTAG